jgi:hypothetical protein
LKWFHDPEKIKYVEAGIRNIVIILNENGLKTRMSCEGHHLSSNGSWHRGGIGGGMPYITFDTPSWNDIELEVMRLVENSIGNSGFSLKLGVRYFETSRGPVDQLLSELKSYKPTLNKQPLLVISTNSKEDIFFVEKYLTEYFEA